MTTKNKGELNPKPLDPMNPPASRPTKFVRVLLEIEVHDELGQTENGMRDQIEKIIKLMRPGNAISIKVSPYSRVQAGETKRLRKKVRVAPDAETAAASITQRSVKPGQMS